ncbi:MAG: hypothetical protein IH843_02720 [Thaumarchaeota archaeon]|nr:hypothetical protein [Nitrososphaerota archaeon]
MKFNFILAIIITLAIIVTPLVFAINLPSTDNDLDLITLEIIDIQILLLEDTPGDYLNNADLVKISIKVTNDNLDYFLLNDNMIKLWVMEPDYRKSTPDNKAFDLVDNYSTIYDDELEVIYDNLQSRELFEECDWIIERIRIGQSKEITVCYNILRSWNNEILNIDGEKQYYLVMMNNHYATSCPNCKKILLSSLEPTLKYQIPSWVQNLFEWHQIGIISDREFEYSIEYLVAAGIIPEAKEKIQPVSTLENKNMHLKEHQTRLSLAQQTNLYVSAMSFYETNYSENFTGVICKKQNNVVTFSGDYTNDDAYYKAVFFKLLVFDELNNVVSTGLSKIVDVIPGEFTHFSVSTPYKGKINSCFVMIDSKFP